MGADADRLAKYALRMFQDTFAACNATPGAVPACTGKRTGDNKCSKCSKVWKGISSRAVSEVKVESRDPTLLPLNKNDSLGDPVLVVKAFPETLTFSYADIKNAKHNDFRTNKSGEVIKKCT